MRAVDSGFGGLAPPPSWRQRWRAAAASKAAPAACLVLLSLLAAYLASPLPAPSSSRYELGEFTSAAIRAPYDFTVVDEEATRRRREEARRSVPFVATVDPRVPQGISNAIIAAFRFPRAVFEEAAKLRQAPADGALPAARRRALERERAALAEKLIAERLDAAIAEFQRGLAISISEEERRALSEAEFGDGVLRPLLALVEGVYATPVTAGQLPPEVSSLSVRNSATGAEAPFVDGAALRNIAEARAELESASDRVLSTVAHTLRPLLARIVSDRLVPDLRPDPVATEGRRAAAAAAVIPVSLTFRRNQLIVGEGQEVTPTAKLVLSYLDEQARPRTYAARFAGAALLVSLLLFVGLRVVRANSGFAAAGPSGSRHVIYITASLAATWVAFWIWLKLADAVAAGPVEFPRLALILIFPFAALPMQTRSMIGLDVARIQLIIAAIVAGLLSEFGLLVTAFAFVTGLLGAHLVGGCRRRGEILRAGAWTGVLSAAVALPVALLAAGDWAATHLAVLASGMASGLVSSLVVVAASRVTEWLFGYTTPVRLLEMVSYDQPLLRDLAVRAPGTFQHSVAVAALADNVAQAVGADALLVRAGALYHDVGKLTEPQFFGENKAGVNPHDGLDPRESARVILRHVADGVRLASRFRLGEAVADCIREHHGRTTVSYFLERAREQDAAVDPEDFRYPGPSPASRETAILMITDTVEATSRSMPGASEQEVRIMVDRSIGRLRDNGELDRASLTLGDLRMIGDTLVRALVGLRHDRVSYPKPSEAVHEA